MFSSRLKIRGFPDSALSHSDTFSTPKSNRVSSGSKRKVLRVAAVCVSPSIFTLFNDTQQRTSPEIDKKKHRARLLKTHFRPFFMIVEQIIFLGQEALRRTIFPIAWNVDVFLFIYSASFSAVAQFPNSFAAFGSGQDFSSRRFCLASNNKERARDDREDAARKYFDRHHSARWSADLSGY